MKNKDKGVAAYKKEFNYSYTFGAYPTIEMLKNSPQIVQKVYIHSAFKEKNRLEALCKMQKIQFSYDDKVFDRLSNKENCYVIGVFGKFQSALEKEKPHIVLVNQSNMGNLGTIIRTMAGFNILNLAIITPSADIFNPKTVRASMGALFRITFQHFSSFDEYRASFNGHKIFLFMLNGENILNLENCPKEKLFSLVFGNEASGLDTELSEVGTSIKIPQTDLVDSLNLPVAVGVGAYVFAVKNRLIRK